MPSLSGGPAVTYVPAIRHHPTNKVALTGYQVEGTPGRSLLDTGSAGLDGRVMPVIARVELHEFSAHADRQGLLVFLESYRESDSWSITATDARHLPKNCEAMVHSAGSGARRDTRVIIWA